MNRFRRMAPLAAVALLAGAGMPLLQDQELDETLVALTYHRITGDSLDLERAAGFSQAVRGASDFDRPDAVKAEVARLQAAVTAADPAHEFLVNVNTAIGPYDHDKGEFSISLFEAGSYVPLTAFGEEYRLVFANAEPAHAIPMPKDQAREFDAKLAQMGRGVMAEVRFRVIGQGDPAGGVSGRRVVRAEILGARLLDRQGQLLFTPTFQPAAAVAAAPAFDPAAADVAGLRVGVKAADLEATLTRLFGKVERGGASSAKARGMVASLEVNSLGCMKLAGRRNVGPGSVCIIAYLDKDDIVRWIRVERLFPPFDGEVFRTSLLRKYGPVSATNGGGYGFTLSWGPSIPGEFFNGIHALTATVAPEQEMDLGGNRIADLKVSLQLVDAAWVAQTSK